jgi:hypothetical protein
MGRDVFGERQHPASGAHAVSDSLGKVLESYGGKSLGLVLGIGGGIALLAIVSAIVGLVVREYFGPAMAVGGVILAIAVMYVATNLAGVFTKAEVCAQGVRIASLSGTKELRWDEIDRIEVGTYRLNGKQRWGVTIHDETGNSTDLSPEFWDSAGGPTRFIAVARQFTTVDMV